jgi:hypothetical protein
MVLRVSLLESDLMSCHAQQHRLTALSQLVGR